MSQQTSVDPGTTTRRLTPGEIEMAQTIFGKNIDYTEVRINKGIKLLPGQESISKFLGQHNIGDRAHAKGSNIYYPPGQYSEDFSKSGSQHTFIHEMTHVWQHQQNPVGSFVKNIASFAAKGFEYDRLYSYKIDPDKKFSDYNHEQQAQMAADYFMLKKNGPVIAKATPESLEKDPEGEGRKALDAFARQMARNPQDPYIKDGLESGRIVIGADGKPHFGQVAADEMNEKSGYNTEQKLPKLMESFVREQAYVKDSPRVRGSTPSM